MSAVHCTKCGANLQSDGKCRKCVVKKKYEGLKCSYCGKTFDCSGSCGGPPCKYAKGPCCSEPPEDSHECWKGMPYYEDWLRKKLRLVYFGRNLQ